MQMDTCKSFRERERELGRERGDLLPKMERVRGGTCRAAVKEGDVTLTCWAFMLRR